MAGDWLKVEVALPDKPEVWQIAGVLNCDPDAVVGKLLKVWRWFDAHTEDGNAPGVTFALVDSIVGVTGFAEAMSFAGWLEQRDRILHLPHFDRHNGKTAKNRALTAKRVAKTKAKSNGEGNAPIVTSALPREEKRREEKKIDAADAAASPAAPADPSSRPPCPHKAIVALYHEVLPELRQVREWNETRQKFLARRWAEDASRQTLDWWREFFGYVRKSRFLMGQTTGRDGRAFDCDLEWLVRPTNFAKVVEGKYEDEA